MILKNITDNTHFHQLVYNTYKCIIDRWIESIGLEINFNRCNLFLSNTCREKEVILDEFQVLTPFIKIIDNQPSLRLLGYPYFEFCISVKIQKFQDICDFIQLKHILHYHHSFLLFRA